ncbi:hypothetical protein TRAPUB_2641 [Trametes pubescens]|uniref:Uncharacterized protein n=1 Tax=Trametes pubescens TaxID=154538 RepID=A0A1M2VFV2_TRAPU|nr:hypothetical protein TRAPUB_2641 [Trametes pubescens]
MRHAPAHPHPRRSQTWRIPLPDFTLTSHGVRARLLVVESSAESAQSALAIAVLACQDTATGAFVGLLLRRRVDGEIGLRWPRYHVGVTVRGMHHWMRLRYRLAQVDWACHALSFNSSGISARWRRLYIAHRPPSRAPPEKAREDAVFRFHFPRWLAVELGKEGFKPDVQLPTGRAQAERMGEGALATFTFTHERLPEAFRIHVGLCKKIPWATAMFSGDVPDAPSSSSAQIYDDTVQAGTLSGLPTLARREFGTLFDRERGPDAISTWSNGSRVFGDSQRNIQLTFTRMNAGNTHVLDVRVGGAIFERAGAGLVKISSDREILQYWQILGVD